VSSATVDDASEEQECVVDCLCVAKESSGNLSNATIREDKSPEGV